MASRYAINKSDDLDIMYAIKMDNITKEVMRSLGLRCFRSTQSRSKDYQIARGKWGRIVDMKDYSVHHMLNGLVGLAPRELHSRISHKGYFWRLSHSDLDL